MAWLEITVSTTADSIDDTAAMLTAAGFSELVLEDQSQFEDFLEENRACWDYIDEQLQEKLQGLSHIKLYLDETDAQSLSRLQSMGLNMTVTALPETDWENSWQEHYPAVEVGEKLIVLPYWLADTDESGRTPVILDPGLTFGTGAHPSTQMVMEAMEQRLTPGSHCLDLGSGSGILSIAALRLGAASATGVDIDPKAEDIARENAAMNDLAGDRFTAVTGDVIGSRSMMEQLARGGYDVVLANIVADVIIPLSTVVPHFLRPDGVFICSGILDTRLDEVRSAIEQAGLRVTEVERQEDWCRMTAVLC